MSRNCCILVNIVVEGVVASEGNQRPEAQAVGEENLSGSVKPHLRRQEKRNNVTK